MIFPHKLTTSKQHLRTTHLLAVALAACLILPAASSAPSVLADDWTQFRGAGGLSVAAATLPKKFDDETNVAWKIPMPAKGASGPIVIGDRVIVTCSGGENQDQLYTVCIDAKTGKELWTQKFWATGRCFVHPLSANAAPTPASDGERIYVFYSSNDLACLDLDGNLLWFRGLAVDFPKAGNDVGMSSSPVVKDGVVVVQVECQADSFAMGLDALTGETVWTDERPKEAMWSSPLLVNRKDKPAAVVLQSKDGFDVLDIKSGQPIFQAKGEVSSISSAAATDEKLFVPINGTTSYAVTAEGDLVEEWNSPQIRPSSMSSVVAGDKLYTLGRSGVLSTFNAVDGTETEKIRVITGGSAWATPIVADNHMYLFAQQGQSYVVKLATAEGEKSKIVSKHTFADEVFLGSPAVADDAMYIRSDKYLWKIAE